MTPGSVQKTAGELQTSSALKDVQVLAGLVVELAARQDRFMKIIAAQLVNLSPEVVKLILDGEDL